MSDLIEYSRWWLASTAFPLLAVSFSFLEQKKGASSGYLAIYPDRLADVVVKGTFGPMASAFSVCALVEDWRVMIPPGGTESNGVEQKDPKWCAFDPYNLALL